MRPHRNPRRWLVAAALLTAVIVSWRPMLDLLARQMLYPAPAVPVPTPPPPYEEVRLRLPEDASAVAWSYWPSGGGDAGPAVLFLHGNGENLETVRQAGLFEQLADLGAGSLAVDYPGYGRSTGTPSEASLIAAGEAAFFARIGPGASAAHGPGRAAVHFGAGFRVCS